MKNGFKVYSEIKKLLEKYEVMFKSSEHYDNFIRELTNVLKI